MVNQKKKDEKNKKPLEEVFAYLFAVFLWDDLEPTSNNCYRTSN